MAECKAAGRHKRSPAMATYRNGNRSDVNKTKKMKRHKLKMERHANHLTKRFNEQKPQRGDARHYRRVGMKPQIPIDQQVVAYQPTRPRERTRIQRNNINLHAVGL
jgi:hypothetical protein